MKAARLHNYDENLDENLRVEEVDEPKIEGPLDVIVRIGGAGLCAALTSISSKDSGRRSLGSRSLTL